MLKEQPRGIPFTLRLVGPKKAFGEWKMFLDYWASLSCAEQMKIGNSRHAFLNQSEMAIESKHIIIYRWGSPCSTFLQRKKYNGFYVTWPDTKYC